jgi:hypothetical protein
VIFSTSGQAAGISPSRGHEKYGNHRSLRGELRKSRERTDVKTRNNITPFRHNEGPKGQPPTNSYTIQKLNETHLLLLLLLNLLLLRSLLILLFLRFGLAGGDSAGTSP